MNRFRGAGRRGDDVDRRRPSSIRILVRQVLHVLVVRVGVDGRHQARFDTERRVQDFRDGGETVRRAARVRNAPHGGSQPVMVDAEHARQIGRVLRRSAQHDPLGARLDMRVVTGLAARRPAREHARALDHNVDAQRLPGELERIPFRRRPDRHAVDEKMLRVVADFSVKTAVDTVVLEQRGEHRIVGKVVDANHLELRLAAHQIPKRQPTDPSKPVDCHSNRHDPSPLFQPNFRGIA